MSSERRKDLVKGLDVMQRLAANTNADSVIGQVRKNLYEAAVQSIKTELDAINGGANDQLFTHKSEYQRAA